MDMTTYSRMIDVLTRTYEAEGVPLYRRGGVTYPFTVMRPDVGDTLSSVLAPHPPRDEITQDSLAFYDNHRVEAIRAKGGKLFNGVTFIFDRLEQHPMRLHANLGRYFDHISTSVALEDELVRGESSHLRDQLHTVTPPSKITQQGAGRSAAIGGNTLIVFRREGQYFALFTQRSADTAHRPNSFHVIPAFTFQPSGVDYPAREWNVMTHIVREYLEELFGALEIEDGGDIDHQHPALQHLNQMLTNGDAELHFTGLTVNLMTTHLSLCSVLVIHDEDWWPMFAGQSQTWETRQIYTLPIVSDAALLEPLPDDFFLNTAPNGAASLWLGVDVARQTVDALINQV